MADPTPEAPPPRNLQLRAGSPDGEGVCDHCGAPMKRIWGHMLDGSEPLGVYIVTWPPGRSDHSAGFDLVINDWRDAAGRSERVAIAIDLGLKDGEIVYGAADPTGRLELQPDLFDRPLSAAEFLASPRQAEVLGYVQAIRDFDPRLEDVRNWGKA